ncbi:MAG: sigma-70 family RNA polymerase sigma factor [Deltaproteobacteria bacterium]|nr:sigma-70 family RNA polymerase sigma factor [Deltaproteobacteria bacterium]MBT4262964.1 sigma-70 family RNA polymerase sigma factor [Deltaproteobacteria bacterium]MBT4644549.1 sigma-70 family RNA polymerase sigma factor [Deltaproteobacteria bacterium]MBT6501440.1 sigma-70 family RNA polymerase sigma factor [Deltaproteobacteria bacterium]MBT6616090.1 sigma-70 family RNA polymerase sigma factor [Deltaproteobacteria bacterium]
MDSSSVDFGELYHEFHPKIMNYLNRLIRNSEVEDLAQEVFMKVAGALPNFKGESKLSTWIYKIATHTAMDRMRSPDFRRTHQIMADKLLAPADGPEWHADESVPVVEQLIKTEMNQCIRGNIDDLPEKYRTVLVLSELQELRNREIAEILDISLESVKIRLHRARGLLRGKLNVNCDFYHNSKSNLACVAK